MNDDLCHQLDDYLLDELPDQQRERFAQHLRECETCRSISEQQAMIEEQLKSASRAVPVPSGLSSRARQHIERDRRRRVMLSAVCVAGVAGIVVSLWFLSGNIDRRTDPALRRTIVNETPEPTPAQEDSLPEETAAQDPEPAVQISFPDNVLAVPVESGDPTITLIQVYPVAKTDSETQ
jgi:anti-sigma factor RsiW